MTSKNKKDNPLQVSEPDNKMVCKFDFEGKLLYANKIANSFFGENFQSDILFDQLWFKNLINQKDEHHTESINCQYNIKGLESDITWICTVFSENGNAGRILCIGSIEKSQPDQSKTMITAMGFAPLFYKNPSVMVISDFQSGKFIDVNEAFCDLTGYSRDEIIGKTAKNLTVLPGNETKRELYDLVKTTNRIPNIEISLKNRKGEDLCFVLSSEVVEEHGKKYILSAAINITDQKRKAEEISQNEYNLRILFDSLNELIFIINSDFNIQQVNKAVIHKLGYEPDQIINKSFFSVFPEHEKENAGPLLQKALEKHLVLENIKLKDNNGDESTFELNVIHGKWNNAPAIIIAAADITERQSLIEKLRESKESLKSIIQSSPDAIALFSRDLELITFNSAFAGALFDTTAKIVRRNMHLQHIFTGKLKILWEIFLQSVEENIFIEKELTVFTNDGRCMYFNNVFQPVYKDDQLIGYSHFMRNITDKKVQELKIAESEKQLSEAQHIARLGYITKNYQTNQLNISLQTFSLVGIDPDPDIKSISQFYKYIHPDDLDYIIEYRQNILDNQPESFQLEIRIIDIHQQVKYLRIIGRLEKSRQNEIAFLALTLQDITSQKQYEIKLQQINDQIARNHEQLRAIFDTVPGIMIVLDSHQNVIDLNSAACELFNITEKNVAVGTTCNELFSKTGVDISDALKEVFGESKFVSLVTGDETHKILGKTFKVYISPVLNQLKQVSGAVVILMDISDLKKATSAFEESQTRLQLAIESANEGLWDWDLTDQTLFVNEQWFKMLGYQATENKLTYEFWLDLLHPDDFQQTVKALDSHLQGNSEMFDIEFRMRTRKGQYKWFLSKGKVVKRDANGKPLRLIGTHLDITQRKLQEESLRESENRLKLALEGANEGLWDWNLITDKVFFSQSWLDMLGYTRKQAEEAYEWWEDLIHLDDVNNFRKSLKKHITGETKYFESEYRMKTHKGDWMWILGHGKVVEFDKDGKPARIIGTQIDITERKNMMRAVEKTEKELRELVATKDKLFSIIAHDLKNPFNLMAGFSELLTSNFDEYDSETIQKFINIIYNASVQGNQLLENLLQWSRAQTGRLVVTPQKANTFEVIESTIRLLKGNAESKGVHLIINDDQSHYIWADINIVETIIRNLVSNAIKFSLRDQKITIETTENNDFVEISVIDRGVGMPRETVEKLFTVSTIQSTIGTANEKGTGLGLVVCKEFAEKNGGEIHVESRFGFGSRFWFTIPKYKNQD